jgi:hypothetical protein
MRTVQTGFHLGSCLTAPLFHFTEPHPLRLFFIARRQSDPACPQLRLTLFKEGACFNFR